MFWRGCLKTLSSQSWHTFWRETCNFGYWKRVISSSTTQSFLLYTKISLLLGYKKLFGSVKKWLNCSDHSLRHNTQVLCSHLAQWGRERIILGTLEDWKTAAQYERFPKDLTRVDLWIDSTDFCLSGKLSTPRSDLMWSYKCNSPGCRYTFLADARGQIRKVWGGYSLKTYDGMFLQQQATWLEEQLAGARVIADPLWMGYQKPEWGGDNNTNSGSSRPPKARFGWEHNRKDPHGKTTQVQPACTQHAQPNWKCFRPAWPESWCVVKPLLGGGTATRLPCLVCSGSSQRAMDPS